MGKIGNAVVVRSGTDLFSIFKQINELPGALMQPPRLDMKGTCVVKDVQSIQVLDSNVSNGQWVVVALVELEDGYVGMYDDYLESGEE